jgi:hypothetical protein
MTTTAEKESKLTWQQVLAAAAAGTAALAAFVLALEDPSDLVQAIGLGSGAAAAVLAAVIAALSTPTRTAREMVKDFPAKVALARANLDIEQAK